MEAEDVVGGRYRLLELIGEGGMSVVWKAHDEVLLRPVAIKVLAAPYAADPAFRESIRAEAQAAARLSHPNVANVYDYGESDETGECVPFVVMELLRGQSLSARLSAGALPPELAMRICAEIAGALAAAHAQGLVHRDVKPGNVILTAAGAKVFDFGIAAWVGDLDDIDVDRSVVGTPAYLAPERIRGALVAPASDVYSLGVLLYRAATGSLPWTAASGEELMIAHLNVDPEALPTSAGLPAEVAALYERCLAKEPAERPAAREVAVVLAAAAGIRPPLEEDDPGAAMGVGEDDGTEAFQPSMTLLTPHPVRPVSAIRTRASGKTRIGGRTGAARKAGAATALGAAALLIGAAAWTVVGDGAAASALYSPWSMASAAPDPAGEDDGVDTPPEATAAPPTVDPTRAPGPNVPPATPIVERPGPPAPAPAPTSAGTNFTSPGGSVWAACERDQAYLVSWTAAPGFVANGVEPGPRREAKINFRAGKTESKFIVTCRAGVPTAKIENRP